MRNAAKIAIWGGKSLPYKKRVEYLETTAEAYIDTGIIAKSTDELQMDVWLASQYSGAAFVGAANDSTRLATVWATVGGAIRFGGAATMGSGQMWNIAGWNTLRVNASGGALNGYALTNSGSGFDDSKSTQSIYVFRCHNFITPPVTIRISSFKWLRSGELVADYIPVLDLEGNPKMFDLVTQSYPTHYGTFVAGPELVGGGCSLICFLALLPPKNRASRNSARRSSSRYSARPSTHSQWRAAA